MYDKSIEVEPWQVEDYRKHPIDFIFKRLRALGFALDEKQFITYAKHAESPEQLSELICDDANEFDKVYLLIFELWRRLLPTHKTASIQCDEICYQIFRYEHEDLANFDELFEALSSLEEMLEDLEDEGLQKSQILHKVSELCGYNLENFLFDFIQNLLDEGLEKEAGELIDTFRPYVENSRTFEFLHARFIFFADEAEATMHLLQILEEELTDIDLLLEIAFFALDLVDKNVLLKSCQQLLTLDLDNAAMEQLIEILQQFFDENNFMQARVALGKITPCVSYETKACLLSLLQELDKN